MLNSIVEQIFIYGDSYQSFIVGVVVPNKPVLMYVLISNNIIEDEKEASDFNALCKEKKVRKFILDTINRTAIENGVFTMMEWKAILIVVQL